MGRNHTSTLSERDRAPDFALPAISGVQVQISDELAKGGVLLVFLRGTF